MAKLMVVVLLGGVIVYLLQRRGRQSSKQTFLALVPEAAPVAPSPDAQQDEAVKINVNVLEMPSYQTATLEEYNQDFQDLAERLFRETVALVGPDGSKKHQGTYGFPGQDGTTAANIVIYQRNLGKSNGSFPMIRDGVYVLLRTKLGAANTIGLAPKHEERFNYRRITEDDLESAAQEIADLISANHSSGRTRALV